jgi:hypothetical protein
MDAALVMSWVQAVQASRKGLVLTVAVVVTISTARIRTRVAIPTAVSRKEL